jgi:hypothetical protein
MPLYSLCSSRLGQYRIFYIFIQSPLFYFVTYGIIQDRASITTIKSLESFEHYSIQQSFLAPRGDRKLHSPLNGDFHVLCMSKRNEYKSKRHPIHYSKRLPFNSIQRTVVRSWQDAAQCWDKPLVTDGISHLNTA